MKVVIAIIITISLVLTVMPAFAKDKTIFQIMHDSMEKEYNAREKKPFKGDVTWFNDAKAALNAMDASSAKVKPLSLNDDKARLARRRGIK